MEKNNAQEEIIHTVNGQLLVVACPGSGKTTTLLRRIHYMINEAKIPAQQILMVTFSSAAAKEMKTRYQKKFGMDAVTFSTIHSMCILSVYHLILFDKHLKQAHVWKYEFVPDKPSRQH